MSDPIDSKREPSRGRAENAASTSRRRPGDEKDDRSDVGPTDAEVEEWAARVRKNRQAWVAGPTEEEKRRWAKRERQRRLLDEEGDEELGFGWSVEGDPIAERARRRLMLAREGMLYGALNWPFWLWSRWIRAGREWEARAYRPTRGSRILLEEDDLPDES